MRAWLAALARLDRRWIFLGLGLLVLLPLLAPPGPAVTPTRSSRQFYDAIERLPEGSLVLLSCGYDPASRPELVPMTRTALRQLWRKRCRVVVTVLWSGGPALVDRTIEEVAAEFRARGVPVVDGVDYVNLGYKAGNEAVMVLMGSSIPGTFPVDQHRRPTATLPILRGVTNYSSVALLVDISAGYPGTREWVQQAGARFHVPIVSGCASAVAPECTPYLDSGQLRGLLAGMAGAAEYEQLAGERGAATRGMGSQSLAHGFVALCIVVGGAARWARKKEGRP